MQSGKILNYVLCCHRLSVKDVCNFHFPFQPAESRVAGDSYGLAVTLSLNGMQGMLGGLSPESGAKIFIHNSRMRPLLQTTGYRYVAE